MARDPAHVDDRPALARRRIVGGGGNRRRRVPLRFALLPSTTLGVTHWLVSREGLAYVAAQRFDSPKLRAISDAAAGSTPLDLLWRLVNAVCACDKE